MSEDMCDHTCKTFYASLISLVQCVNGKHALHMQNIIDRLFLCLTL